MLEIKIIECDNGGYFVTLTLDIEYRYYYKDKEKLISSINEELNDFYGDESIE